MMRKTRASFPFFARCTPFIAVVDPDSLYLLSFEPGIHGEGGQKNLGGDCRDFL